MPKFYLVVLVVLYAIPGLVGHDPWKQDETYVFGIIYSMLQSGDWLVPMLAGEPFMEKPPLFYWVALLFAKLLSPPLPLHDAARLASGFFTLTTLWCIERCGRLWWGEHGGRMTAIALMSSAGLLFHAHIMETDIALLAGFAVAFLGVSGARDGSWKFGLLLGCGVGMGFLSKGVLAPTVMGLTCAILPLCFREWRTPAYWRNCGIALAAVLPWLLVWPVVLYLRSPQLFMDWFWLNNVGRYLGFAVPLLGAPHKEGFWLRNIPWLTFPVLPLAVYTLYLKWREPGGILRQPALQLCMVMMAVIATILFSAASARAMYGLPLLLPLAIMATPAALSLPAALNRRVSWGLLSLVLVLGILIWRGWWRMLSSGVTPQLAWLQRHLPSHFPMPLSFWQIAMAVAISIAALLLAASTIRNRSSAVASLAIGFSLLWGLTMTLWLPWINEGKSYRSAFVSLRHSVSPDAACLASMNMGESERAMLHYVNGTITQRLEHGFDTACPWLLVQGSAIHVPPLVASSPSRVVWEGARNGDRKIRFWLLNMH
ncbi:MAG TPA: glycosyltransferase family 39 protein [Burkholderiaceae bacterium]|nr:glycosyltransferase family 39 protein [Burkholderiaceae bacterium]